MNKNIVLLGLGAIAFVLVGGLFLFSPQKEHVLLLTQPLSSQTSINKENITITYQKENPKISNNKSSKHRIIKSNPKPKKIDKSIKAYTYDHSRRYLVKLVDMNNDKSDIRPTNDPKQYYPLSGTINNNYFYLKVPKELIGRPNIKLVIKDRKSNQLKSFEIDNILNDLITEEDGNKVFLKIENGKIKESIQEPKVTYGVPAIPHL